MSIRSLRIINMALADTDRDILRQLNGPTYDTKGTTSEEQMRALLGFSVVMGNNRPCAVVQPTNTPKKEEAPVGLLLQARRPVNFEFSEVRGDDHQSCNSDNNGDNIPDEMLVPFKPCAVVHPSSTPNKEQTSALLTLQTWRPPNLEFEEARIDLGENPEFSEENNSLNHDHSPHDEDAREDSDYIPDDSLYSSDNVLSPNSPTVSLNEKINTRSKSKTNKIASDNDKSGEDDEVFDDRIVVSLVERNKAGIIMRNKCHCCLYCNKVMINLPKHFESIHKNEIGVAKLLALEKKSQNRRSGFIELSRVGDYYHNIEVLAKEKGELIVARRPSQKEKEQITYSNYVPCPDCLGFFQKKQLWHHVKYSCSAKSNKLDDSEQQRKILSESKTLLQSSLSPRLPQEYIKEIQSRLRNDEISDVCKEDTLITKYGVLQYEKYGLTQNEMIRQHMRQLGRFTLQLRKHECNEFCRQPPNEKFSIINQRTTLDDWLQPMYFDCVIETVKKVCQEIPTDKQKRTNFGIPSLALKLGHSIKKCINIKRGIALRMCNKTEHDSLKNFLDLINLEWSIKISSNALDTLQRRKMNKTKILPLTEDLVALNKFLIDEIETSLKTPISNWSRLADATLCKVVLFNKRRSGEASRILIETYNSRPSVNNYCTQELEAGLSDLEKKLSKRMSLVEVVGKRGKKVPILLTPDLIQSIDVLISCREKAGISKTNPYIFARQNSEDHIRGHDCLRKLSSEANLTSPTLVTSTNLRKYIATVIQIFDLTENETDWFARHLGHDIRVHREFYRTHEGTVETAKISKILIAAEQGKAHLYAGKKLQDINVDSLECTDDSSDSDSAQSTFKPDCDQAQAKGSSKDVVKGPVKRKRIVKALECTDESSDSDLEQSTFKPVCDKAQPKGESKDAVKGPVERKHIVDAKEFTEDKSEPNVPFQAKSKTSRKHHAPKKPQKEAMECSEDESEAETVGKDRVSKKPKRKVHRRPWSKEEKESVMVFFRNALKRGTIPKKEECEQCKIESNNILKERTWRDVKYFIYNQLKKIKH